ncbi:MULTISPECIES: HEAT repeat domain-containing protein [Cyanophyceae]|uniref:HEAT repeat domain-containing protein n=1 Tax=Cyanophyceae TaxID=3028117 RepID=UPI0018EFBD9B|nr:HEAT repeat domain-containing protein [Trichocoleus sp. FACHB-69]
MIDWKPYLEALCNKYAQWSKDYTLTDVVGRQRIEVESPPLLEFIVETVQPAKEQPGEAQQKTERLGVLEGLRKYAADHVLLVGRPGLGKSTALARLLLEEAQASREINFLADSRIPVLVELRYYQTSVLDLIRDFLKQHGLFLNTCEIERLLFDKQFLLLVDGINELPSEAARRDLKAFRQTNAATPMIFTTRDLGLGGDLDIAKKLEMQPLGEAQMQQFVCAYLPQQGEQMLRQLGSRLRELGETPLLLWMLCSVFADNRNKIPSSLGSVFCRFTQIYTKKLKQDIPISGESRRWLPRLLEQLAWVMTSGKAKTELQVAIPRQEAEAVLTEFLAGKVAHPEDCVLCWLEDLLNHHLIQLGANNQIEFRHQLIQEYYTAECLFKQLPHLIKDGDRLKRDYLNYLKWTEPLALMLELVEDEEQAVRVVRLALEVDLRLGARLAGAVKRDWQGQTVGLVAGLEIPQLLKFQLLCLTKSEKAIPSLIKALKHEYSYIRANVVDALGNIGSEAETASLIKALEDEDSYVRWRAADALGNIGSEAAIASLIKALEDEDSYVRSSVADALGKIGSEAAIPCLIKVLEHGNSDIRAKAVEALGRIGSEAAVSSLNKALEDEDSEVRSSAAAALGEIGAITAISSLNKALEDHDTAVRKKAAEALMKIDSKETLAKLIKDIGNKDVTIRKKAAITLGYIGSKDAIPSLVKALKDGNYGVRYRAASSLGKIGSEVPVPSLTKSLEDEHSAVSSRAAEALVNIGSEAAILSLIKALEAPNYNTRGSAAYALKYLGSESRTLSLVINLGIGDRESYNWIAYALRKIESKAAIPSLIKALEDEDSNIRDAAAYILGEIGSKTGFPYLVKVLNGQDHEVRKRAIDALGKIRAEAAVPCLIKVLDDQDHEVRKRAIDALGKIRAEAPVPCLIKALDDQDHEVRRRAIDALGKIRAEAAVPCLIKVLDDKNYALSKRAAEALGKIGSEAAIHSLKKLLKNEDSNIRRIAAYALGKIRAEATIPYLSKVLDDEDCDVRRTAADALGEIKAKVAIPCLIQALSDEDPGVRSRAANALGEIGSEEVIPNLTKAIDDENYQVRDSAVSALGKLASEAAVPSLIKALKDAEDFSVPRRAVYALNRVGLEVAISALVQALEDEDFIAANDGYTLDQATEALQAIQKRCGYYNYVIATSPLPQENTANHLVNADMRQYEETLSVISNMVTVMERTPKTFGGIEEEALRDHFLVQLNGKYKGQATGETFNKKGKTDILIRVEGKNIFIAECKFWGGEKKLKETLDQLLGYTTWRDTKLALLIFNRNKNFSAVLEQISEAMKNHPTFTRELSYPSETGFRFILHHPEDKNRELLLTVLAFEIPR